MHSYQAQEINKAIAILQGSKKVLRDGTCGKDSRKFYSIKSAVSHAATGQDAALGLRINDSISTHINDCGGIFVHASQNGIQLTRVGALQEYRHTIIDQFIEKFTKLSAT